MERPVPQNVDSIMELLTEVHIGSDGVAATYPGRTSTSFPAPNYYVDTSALVANEPPPPTADDTPAAKPEDPNALKSWREGMEIKTSEEGPAKTMFITQNLNKAYEEKEQRRTLVAYSTCASKVLRETDYFNMILNRLGEDMKLTERRTNKEEVLKQREVLAKKLNNVKDVIDLFVSKFLTGEPANPSDPADPQSAKNVINGIAEYAFLSEKKPPANGEGCKNLCADCNIEVVPENGQDLEGALLQHAQTELHRACMPEPPPPRKSKQEQGAPNPAAEPVDKKALENLKKSPILRLNKISACLIDDNVTCEVCDATFPSNVQEIFKHMSEAVHKDKLNTYNMGAQLLLIQNNPDVFGEGGQFQLDNIHLNLHKIFVDPTIKQAYCGLCCRQLPFSQSNIDEHISSAKHDKLLVEAVDSSYSEFVSLGIGHDVLAPIKSRSAGAVVEPQAPKEIKLAKKEPPKDEQGILDASDIQNFRKVLPDKPINSIPDLYDGNNVPIHSFDHYEQPELKKYLSDNGLQRQHTGKYRCTYCPDLEIPNSRYAFRHISKHKTGLAGNSPAFDNWKRQPNRQQQQGYGNDQQQQPQQQQQKVGRVVMHKNGVNYWCTSCRLPLIDASTAFAHVKTDNHVTFVDGVSFSSGTIFDCATCRTTINGEKNACQHLIAAKHRENAKAEALAKQEGRLNMIEERKQRQRRREKAEYAPPTPTQPDEEQLFNRNGIVFSPDSGMYHCGYCGWSNRKRPDMLTHIFSYEHTTSMSKQAR